MAEQDASVAIQNALQKLDQQADSLHNVEQLESVKSKLRRWGSSLDKFNLSISKLTEVRELAYDVEDVMDDVIIVAAADAAQRRWRKLANLWLLFSPSRKLNQQIEEITKRTYSIGGSSFDEEEPNAPSCQGRGNEVAVENIPQEKDLFYLSLSGFCAEIEISARKLIQIWVAEGFLDQQGTLVMEEEGRRRVNLLLGRGIITQVERGTSGNLKTFKIDKDKLDACISAAQKEIFLHVVKLNREGRNEETCELRHTRFAIHSQSTSLLTGSNLRSVFNLSKVRSLQIHCNSTNHSPQSDYGFLKSCKKEFGSLRVLDLGCLPLETVPDSIGKLAHLRYLRLKAQGATKIPASICNLPYLQTIDLKETELVKTIPVEIWTMKKNLRHLQLGGSAAMLPPRMAYHYDALESLQTLCGVRPDKELKRLMVRAKFPNVNRLRLQCTSKKDSPEFLSFLNSLDHLYHLQSLTLGGPIGGLPSDWNAFPPSLTKITLLKTRIPADDCVKTLENLPNLRHLKLMADSVEGTEMICAAGGFPALQVLRMEGLEVLDCWKVEKGAMRLLMDLEVRKCEQLTRVVVFEPSKELRDTLQELQRIYPRIAIEVDGPPSNDAAE